MALKRVIVDNAGNLSEIANGDYIMPDSLGSGTPSSNTILDGSGAWVTIASLNYWTLSGGDVYRPTGRVYIGHAASLGAYALQVTGDSYFVGGIMSSQGGTAALPKITLSGSTTTGIYTPAANSWGVSTNGVHALIVNASQFVGINNTNPLTRLHVTDSGAYHIRIERTGVGASLIGMSAQTSNSTGDMLFDMTQASQGYAFRTRNAANAILNSFSINRDGDVGIGTFIPLLTLDARVPSQYLRPSIGGVSPDLTRWGYSLNPINESTSYDLIRSSNIGFRIARETGLGSGTFTTELSINTSGYVGIGINTITGSAGAYYLQVGGDIYGSTLTGSTVLLKTVNGVITRATAADINTILGTTYFIQNRTGSVQTSSNFWISGRGIVGTTDQSSYKFVIDSGASTSNGLHINGRLKVTGNIEADGFFSGTSSDKRYKSNFKSISVIDVIDKINVFSYNHKLYNEQRLIGSVAQNLQKFFPELITKDSKGYLRVDNYGYAALALQLGKELKSEVDILKDRVKELEAEVKKLSN